MLTGYKLREKIKPFARRFAGVSHAHRLAIIHLLAHGPMTATDIAQSVDIPENLASHHLKQLNLAGWILKTKQGRTVTYKLHEKGFLELPRMITDTPFYNAVLSKYLKF